MNTFFSSIDWTQAWYASVRPAAQELLMSDDWRSHINTCAQKKDVRNQRQQAIRFVAQDALPDGAAYETFISTTGQVPTRENLHDFFNALVWLTFPKIKQQLNALQAAQIAQHGIGKSRGAARDAATIFDENSALLVVENSVDGDGLIAALRAHQWQQAFIHYRPMFGQQAEVWAFGHALMEKLVQPYKAITAHAYVVRVEPDFFTLDADAKRDVLDQLVAQGLASLSLSTSDYTPLPVLGLPGWWVVQDEDFYADTQVFRAKRVPQLAPSEI
ncbi:hypothetical protein AAKU64_003684 [Undibacterium sp. GrIS 1.8]|uniref:DUF3025 domain-containing protein n=1 Tax=Undibacterium sp. GrIS 1.8 TaxID=3143934 RepID=UPI003391F159